MPTYTYVCPECGQRFNLFHSISDDSPKVCPDCGAGAQRQMGGGSALNVSNGSGLSSTPSPSIPQGGFT
ncbi:MAG TPA: zinc ribbon domain-containing protein [Bacteroidetes bacterium]|nr:zinc ribbon domain-containing protein [Bacteroidota bacterium]HEX04614.1 zinc ribbon domain-containing protein [Bacteroidota bacterium]